MIISKDLFLLGDSDYLRLPKDEKGNINHNKMSRPDESRFPFLGNRQLSFEIVFQGITVKNILDDVSGLVRPGEMLAVMGPSGSGKTTLLNVLSGRRRPNSGAVFVNGEPLNKRHRRKSCYVLQQDIFFTGLTLKQTILYSALLRLPDKLTLAQKMAIVDYILDLLDLRRCQDTVIGDMFNPGLSGGEKKRASIACELLTSPSLMLLDEPTSGLDSSRASSLISTLKSYAQKEKKTVVVTVHQPSSQIFYMFDKLLLLCNGQTAYFGDTSKVISFFQSIELPITPHYNPADFILEKVQSSSETQEKILKAARNLRDLPDYPLELRPDGTYAKFWHDKRKNQFSLRHHCPYRQTSLPCQLQCPKCHPKVRNNSTDTHVVDIDSKAVEIRLAHKQDEKEVYSRIVPGSPGEDDDSGRSSCSEDSHDTHSHNSSYRSCCEDHYGAKWPTGFWTQFKVLTLRNFQEARPRMLSKLNWVQTVCLGILAGLVWFQIEKTEEALPDIQGWIFFSTTYWMLFALFGALASFPSEREVINKERASGAYRLSAYYLAKMVGELPLTVALPGLYHLISYPMLGFHSLSTFLTLLGFLLINTLVAQSVGLFIGAACMDFPMSTTISALYTLATQLFGGYLVARIPPWLSWLQYLSIIHYAYQNMQIVEFSSCPEFKCAAVNSKFDVCRFQNESYIPNSDVLSLRGSDFPLWLNTLILFFYFLVFRWLGYMVLRCFRKPR